MIPRLVTILLLLLFFAFGRLLFPPQSLLGFFSGSQVSGELQDGYVAAKVYSTYPFNNKEEVTINVGRSFGIKEGAAVFLGDSVLFGQVDKVYDRYSTVKTFYNPNWRVAVRVGDISADAVLIGGSEPMLSMLSSEAKINEGDDVYSASLDFPYGIRIGQVSDIIEYKAEVFKAATVELPYALNQIRDVVVAL